MTNMLSKSVAAETWHCLKPLWQGGKEIVQRGLPHSQLAPTWQMLLLGDGSPTKHLQLLTGEKTEVDLIEMSNIGMDFDRAPTEIQLLPGPRTRRQVWLRTSSGERLAYATSWWKVSHVDKYLQNQNSSIWSSLRTMNAELYRDVRGIYYGTSASLELAFGQKSAFWGRHYLFWHQGQPITLIYEVFSTSLRKYMGSDSIVVESNALKSDNTTNFVSHNGGKI
jgi:chorismate lyase